MFKLSITCNYIVTKELRELGWEGVDWMHLVQGRD